MQEFKGSLQSKITVRLPAAPSIMSESRVSRVSERQPASRYMPPQRSLKMSSAFVVALCLLCFIVDPRDYQEVLAAEGVHPHPGPDPQQGVVMQAVETIEERVQRRKRAEDREQVKGEEKKQRCLSPPLASCESTTSNNLSSGEQKGGGKREAKKGVSKLAAAKIKVTKVKKPVTNPCSPQIPAPNSKKDNPSKSFEPAESGRERRRSGEPAEPETNKNHSPKKREGDGKGRGWRPRQRGRTNQQRQKHHPPQEPPAQSPAQPPAKPTGAQEAEDANAGTAEGRRKH